MHDPRWVAGAAWWKVLLVGFALAYRSTLAWQLWRGRVAIALPNIIASLIVAASLTLLWWVAWGWERR